MKKRGCCTTQNNLPIAFRAQQGDGKQARNEEKIDEARQACLESMQQGLKKIILIHYGEIALKGKNRYEFENRLVKNIFIALRGIEYDGILKKDSRIVIGLTDKSDIQEMKIRLKKVFGIEWLSIAYETEKDVEKIKGAVLDYLANNAVPAPIKIEARRTDKKFKMNSMEISSVVGKAIDEKGFETDLENQKTTIRISILNKSAVISFERIDGQGGLPIGSAGRVLCLLSGGIDSPVAVLQMMRRGCNVDLLHFYQFASHEEVLKSKIMEIVDVLKGYGFAGTLYLAPYSKFYQATFTSIPPKKELVVFRRFMLKVANQIARETQAKGIATGDNLAQVASQTLDNLYVTDEASEFPVYRPLISHDKREIIDLARKYGTYDASIREYKDCCSLVAVKHPETKTKLEEIKLLEENAGIEKIVEETIKEIVVIKIEATE